MSKILLVSNTYSSYISAGTSQRTRDLKKGLSSLGWDCKVATIKRKNKPIENEPDSDDIIQISSISERYPIPLFELPKLNRLIKNSNLVHIIDHFSILNIVTVIFCLLNNIPYVFSPCGALKPIGRNILPKKIYNFLFLKLIIFKAASLFVITKNEYFEVKKLSRGKIKIKIFPNGVWKNPENSSNLSESQKEKFVNFVNPLKYILFVGRLSYVKGPDILLEAFCEIKKKEKFSLIFAGPDDNMKEGMINSSKKYNTDNDIHFLGRISPEQRNYLMKNAFLTVIPSRREAMSLVALESAILSTPFLATSCCGLDDFFKLSAGFICEPNSKSISKTLSKLFLNTELVKNCGKNARNLVLSKYLWDFILEDMSDYLRPLLEKK